jgi:hypothetical protein
MTTATTSSSHTSKHIDNNVNSLSLGQALDYCLDILKIREDSESYRSITQTTITKVPLAIMKTHGSWITAMKLIADCSGILNYNNNNGHVLSQTQLYDFLVLATKVIEEERANNNNILLKILRDIMENYEYFSDYLKSNYPRIIVDVISILHKGIDTKGSKVNPVCIEKYYQSRKQQQATITTTTIAAIHKGEVILKEDFVESLAQITNRGEKELEESLAKLQDSDMKCISELCLNYSRLQKYSKLIAEGSEQEFKKEIQRELGRKLEAHQLRRATDSVKRVRTYIENILDNKFIPDSSHGINHIKHNLEYGYSLMNLIELPRRRPRTG